MSSAIPSHQSDIPARFDAALERLGGDAVLFRDMAEIFTEDLPLLIADMAPLWDQPSQWHELSQAAHRLKGMVVTFDDSLAGPLQQLITATREGDQQTVRALRHELQEEINQLYRQLIRLVAKT